MNELFETSVKARWKMNWADCMMPITIIIWLECVRTFYNLNLLIGALYYDCLCIASILSQKDWIIFIKQDLFTIVVMQNTQVNEFEWYLRDHFFRQFNQGIQYFKKDSLGGEMISLYLRYRNYNLQDMNNMITIVVESLISSQ